MLEVFTPSLTGDKTSQQIIKFKTKKNLHMIKNWLKRSKIKVKFWISNLAYDMMLLTLRTCHSGIRFQWNAMKDPSQNCASKVRNLSKFLKKCPRLNNRFSMISYQRIRKKNLRVAKMPFFWKDFMKTTPVQSYSQPDFSSQKWSSNHKSKLLK